jgi:hypothetical protein
VKRPESLESEDASCVPFITLCDWHRGVFETEVKCGTPSYDASLSGGPCVNKIPVASLRLIMWCGDHRKCSKKRTLGTSLA